MRLIAAALGAAVLGLATALPGTTSVSPGSIVTYAAPGLALSGDYVVKVRSDSGGWRNVDAYQVTVDLDTKSSATMVAFDTGGPVDVSITKTSGTMQSALVRPLAYGITPTIAADGKTATFTLPRPLKVSFEVNGDRLHNVHVFANPPETGPIKDGRKLIYYGPGTHTLPGDHLLHVTSNTTVYIAGGAVVRGGLMINGARNVDVRGHGIVDPSTVFGSVKEETVQIIRSTNVGVRDITILGSRDLGFDIANSSSVVLANIKEINWDKWTDGIDIAASSNVLVDDVFLRTSDDCVAVYASTPWGALGSTRSVTVRNSTLWADVAHPILVGTHGNPAGHDVIDQVVFQNIDILEHDEADSRYQGAMAVDAGDKVTARNIRFDGIRVEDFTRGQLVNVRVFLNPSYNKQPGTAVDSVLFRNVTYNGSGDLTSHIEGYDSARRVTNVTFENLRRNGQLVRDAAAGNISVGPYTANVVFQATAQARAWNDDSHAIRRTGSWSYRAAKGFFRGDEHRTRSAGSCAAFTFTGRQARVIGATAPTDGRATIFVDGKYRATVDTYSRVRRVQQIWFDTGYLARGVHTVKVRATGDGDCLSTGRAIQLDKIEIVT